jgi:hypothetical protein
MVFQEGIIRQRSQNQTFRNPYLAILSVTKFWGERGERVFLCWWKPASGEERSLVVLLCHEKNLGRASDGISADAVDVCVCLFVLFVISFARQCCRRVHRKVLFL